MKRVATLLVLLLVLSGCASYQSRYTPFRPPEAYPNHSEVAGVSLGCQAYPDRRQAKRAFGFDIRKAGLLPVQLVLLNRGGQTVEIDNSQTFLVDEEGNLWPVVPNSVAFQRMEQFSEFSSFFGRGAAKGAFLGAAGGGILATALGIVSGNSVASYLGKGAAVGAAGGAVVGASSEAGSPKREYMISEDLRQKGLEGKTIPDQYLAQGFLFFPGEAKSAKELRLLWHEKESGELRRANLPL